MITAAPVDVYKRRVYTWDALQYDGVNAIDVIAFAGGPDYAKEDEGKIVLRLTGADIQSETIDLLPGQWIMIPKRGGRKFGVVSEAEFDALWELDTPGPKGIQPL